MVSSVEQASRDDERLRVLRDELRKSEALIESLAKRRAERLAVADHVAVQEAEEERVRALSDVAGLKREIAATRLTGESAKATPSAIAQTARTARPKVEPGAHWWDVYSKASRTGPLPGSSPQPPAATAAQTNPTRRME